MVFLRIFINASPILYFFASFSEHMVSKVKKAVNVIACISSLNLHYIGYYVSLSNNDLLLKSYMIYETSIRKSNRMLQVYYLR